MGPSSHAARHRSTGHSAESLHGAYQVRDRDEPHFLHHSPTVDLDGFFGRAKPGGNLLIEQPLGDEFHHLAFAWREGFGPGPERAKFFAPLPFSRVLGERGFDGPQEIVVHDRFGEEIHSAGFHRRHTRRNIPVSGEEHDRKGELANAKLRLKIKTVHRGHPQIDHDAGRGGRPAIGTEKLGGRAEGLHLVAGGAEQAGHGPADRGIVVDQKDGPRALCHD